MKCLVTGAGGFIGSALSRKLADRGHGLVCLVRDQPPPVDGAATLRLELGSEPVPAEQLRSVDVVYHCAGIAHRSARDADYRRVNHEATRELAAVAAVAGVRHFVFLSSVKAAPSGTPYGHWKWRTEQALTAAAVGGSMAITSLRPALVYGPGVKGNLRQLANGVRRHLPRPPAGGGRSLVSLGDLTDVLCLLGESELSGYHCFEVTDGEVYSTRRLYAAIRDGLGKSAGHSWLPRAGWRLACAALDLLRPWGDGASYDRLFGEDIHSNAAVCAALDWRPHDTVESQIDDILVGTP